MNKSRRGGIIVKYLLLLVALGLLAGYFWWVGNYGKIGHVEPLPQSTVNQIAFVRQDGGVTNIYTIGLDGQVRQLTNSKAEKRSPAWSPDGKQICYAGEPDTPSTEGRTFQLFLVGQGEPKQASTGSISKDSPQWRPDGKLIGFLSGGAIKVLPPNAAEMKQIYPPPHVGGAGDDTGQEESEDAGKLPPINSFKWAPDGIALAAVQVMEGEVAPTVGRQQWWEKDSGNSSDNPMPAVVEPESAVLLPNVDADKPNLLTDSGADRVALAWYPDALHLAVSVSTRQKRHGILIYRTDDPHGAPTLQFASEGYTMAPDNPAVSPGGKLIAFEAWRMDSPENRKLLGIAVIPASGPTITVNSAADETKVKMIVSGEAHDPQWSPDGNHILYWMSGKNGNRDLYVANADGSNPKNLTNGVGDNFDASWSPARR